MNINIIAPRAQIKLPLLPLTATLTKSKSCQVAVWGYKGRVGVVMKVAVSKMPAGKVRRLSFYATVMAFFMMVVEPTYASANMQFYVTIPNEAATPQPTSDSDSPVDSTPSLLELDGVKNVDAATMALLSLAIRQVELAREPQGAKQVAKVLIAEKYQWGQGQYECLNNLWTKESNWNYKARNKVSGAHGIPQALPATKMEIVGTDWRTNPVTQISWGLKYIDERYDTPCKAWSKFKRSRWY